ncbi:RES family NAD+ phosphorylase [Desulfosarcina widdelii]|uniref:RES family NAD+ phosphorylase n=1 Tax=Desulfosarcina widdelii TaxID=947919 RepID=UPI00338E9860
MKFPESFVHRVAKADLRPDWSNSPEPESIKIIGDRWIASGSSPELRVPGVIVPDECNYLLNPQHSGFATITIGSSRRFSIDPRLFV